MNIAESPESNETHDNAELRDDTRSLDVLNVQSPTRKVLSFAVLCFALFLDTFNNSSLFSAIPPISEQVSLSNSQSVWLLSAYQLTFSALLLISGRVSDLYDPKWVFVTGSLAMAVFALVGGFLRNKIVLIVFRALMGGGGALTIPSAMHLIVGMYPRPQEQAKAIAVFGSMGGVGIVMGLVIGALFVSFATWPWIFYFSAIVSVFISLGVIILVPSINRTAVGEKGSGKVSRFSRLDLLGVSIITATLVLFIFAVTVGSIDGWRSATVLAPLIISIFLGILFFVFEAQIPEWYAAVPPKMWRYQNFTILIIISLVPFMWWGSIFPLFSWYWETVYGWSAINVAAHFLPIALGIFPTAPLGSVLQARYPLKWVISLGFGLLLVGTILLPFASTSERYWRFTFPGFLLGTAGAAIVYATTNIALLAITPASASGIVSAVFTAVLQTGGATGVAIITSIQTSVQTSPTDFDGRAAGLWFLVAFIGVMGCLFLIFMKNTVGPVNPDINPDGVRKTGADTI